MKKILFCSIISIISCGKKHTPVEPIPQPLEQLQTKYELYKELNNSVQDSNGFILTSHCDSLMYSSLLGIVKPVDILKARDEVGQWFRRPLEYKECYSNGESKATISRDMFTGLMYWLYYNNKGKEAEELLKYGRSHGWLMGEGDTSNTIFVPALQATLALLVEKLTGNKYFEVNYPQAFGKDTSYQAQLTILHILLRAKLLESITDKELEILKYQHDRIPSNALFSYAYHKYSDGNQEDTITILLNEQLFPNNTLPNTNNYCTDWLWSRDLGSDWQPCPEENKTWTGGEFLFITKLLLEDLK